MYVCGFARISLALSNRHSPTKAFERSREGVPPHLSPSKSMTMKPTLWRFPRKERPGFPRPTARNVDAGRALVIGGGPFSFAGRVAHGGGARARRPRGGGG